MVKHEVVPLDTAKTQEIQMGMTRQDMMDDIVITGNAVESGRRKLLEELKGILPKLQEISNKAAEQRNTAAERDKKKAEKAVLKNPLVVKYLADSKKDGIIGLRAHPFRVSDDVDEDEVETVIAPAERYAFKILFSQHEQLPYHGEQNAVVLGGLKKPTLVTVDVSKTVLNRREEAKAAFARFESAQNKYLELKDKVGDVVQQEREAQAEVTRAYRASTEEGKSRVEELLSKATEKVSEDAGFVQELAQGLKQITTKAKTKKKVVRKKRK